jgi:hypothetical protein
MDRLLAMVATSENPESSLGVRVVHSEVLRAEGKTTEALAEALEGLELRTQFGLARAPIKRAWAQAAEAALELGDLETVEGLLAIVEGAWPGQVMPYLRGSASSVAGRVAALRGDDGTVEPAFLAAEQTFRQVRFPFDLAVTLTHHGEWLRGTGQPDRAETLLAEAREIFEQLRATPWLERLDALAGVEAGAEQVTPA